MSREKDSSLLVSLTHYICPCFRYKQQEMNKQPHPNPTTESQEPSSQNQTHFVNLMSETVEVKPQKNACQEESEVKIVSDKIMQSPVMVKYKEEDSDNIDYNDIEEMQLEFMKYMQKHTLISRPKQPKQTKLLQVEKYSQNKLLVIGSQAHRLLTKIKKVEIQPSTASVNLQRSAKNHNKQEKTNDATIQKFWERRYILFEKFDQGIKLDTQSWYSVTPQAVAEHIASKIAGFDCVLDAFAGAGGDSIQLSLTNKQVISNDIDPAKVNLLINNAAVYGIDNIQTYSLDFFELQFAKGQVGAVYMSPPWGGIDYYQAQAIKPEDMFPSLQNIILKSLSISQNMALLLPANMDIQLLAKEISSCAEKLQIGTSCSILIQKIYFQDRLKFLLVLFGTKLTGINLGDELDFIYSLLAQGKAHFIHKRVIKKLREDIGLIKLINIVLECQKRSHNPNKKQITLYDVFIDLILQRKLISLQKLQKLNQMDELDDNYRSKQTSKKEKIKSKQNQALAINNPQKKEGEVKEAKVIRMSVINSSGIQQTVSYISEMSESKLPNTNQNHSLSDPESSNHLQTTINIQATQHI